MKNQLSILIPIYNQCCVPLIEALAKQATALDIDFEIIVADDGSTDELSVRQNRAINALPSCRYWERPVNVGRAAIRNALARESRYDWLLFIDGDLGVVRSDFVSSYLVAEGTYVVVGGIVIGDATAQLSRNLRFLYEKNAERHHTVECRRLRPYADFHTANFMIRRTTMLDVLFDECFSRYGHEDVAFGMQLSRRGVSISHIDNPIGFLSFEPNALFVDKTDQAIQNLVLHRDVLLEVSRLLALAERLHKSRLDLPLKLLYKPFRKAIRRQLCGENPVLALFNIYKIGEMVVQLTSGFSADS